MMKKLSINFNNTFSPDRLMLSLLLIYVKENPISSISEIQENTGITNGKSTGKVQPYLNYLSGMGLINYAIDNSKFVIELTPFGKIVLEEDCQMSMNLTQWICHANMCNLRYGSDVWIAFFDDWKKDEIRDLNQIINRSNIKKSKFTPLINMYNNEDCFNYSKILRRNDKNKFCYYRNSAPLFAENIPAYGALLIDLLENNFKKEQVSIFELEKITGFSNIFGWDSNEAEDIYNRIASLGYIKISSLMTPKCIQALISKEKAWKMLYNEVI